MHQLATKTLGSLAGLTDMQPIVTIAAGWQLFRNQNYASGLLFSPAAVAVCSLSGLLLHAVVRGVQATMHYVFQDGGGKFE